MKHIFALIIAVAASAPALADDQQPPALSPVEASLIESFEGCKHVVLIPGSFGECDVTSVASLKVTNWNCKSTEAIAAMYCSDGTSFHFAFNKSFVQHKLYKTRWVDEFRFEGTVTGYTALLPEDAQVVIDVWNFVDQPGNFRGTFEVQDYGVSKALVGHPIR